jgi:mRNA-degrading endonuclease HigB of HigAB toxin-antitoxin module
MDDVVETLCQANQKVDELVKKEKGRMADLSENLEKAQKENEELKNQMEEVKKENQRLKVLQGKIEKEKVELDAVFKTFYEKTQKESKGKVVLDVGGKFYTTTVTTLCSEPKSMLATMFSGRYDLPQSEDGSIFIDRDGDYFGNILHYLRTKTLPTFSADKELSHTLKEAEYYQLDQLVKAISSLQKVKQVYKITKNPEGYLNEGWTPEAITGGASLHVLFSKEVADNS